MTYLRPEDLLVTGLGFQLSLFLGNLLTGVLYLLNLHFQVLQFVLKLTYTSILQEKITKLVKSQCRMKCVISFSNKPVQGKVLNQLCSALGCIVDTSSIISPSVY